MRASTHWQARGGCTPGRMRAEAAVGWEAAASEMLSSGQVLQRRGRCKGCCVAAASLLCASPQLRAEEQQPMGPAVSRCGAAMGQRNARVDLSITRAAGRNGAQPWVPPWPFVGFAQSRAEARFPPLHYPLQGAGGVPCVCISPTQPPPLTNIISISHP